MTIIGYNNHSERVASLIIEARKSLADTAAQNPPVNSTSTEAKATLDSILSDANAVASGLEPYTELWYVLRVSQKIVIRYPSCLCWKLNS